MRNQHHVRTGWQAVLAIVFLATVTRIAGPSFGQNFAPMNAIALFSGAYFGSALLAIGVPLLSIIVGDYAVNYLYSGAVTPLYPGWYWQYASYVALACIGMLLHNRIRPLNVLAATLGSSVLFFFVSNFGVWFSTGLYPRTLDGLAACYVLALPFFKSTLLSDLLYVALMFGVYELVRRSDLAASPRSVAV